jgi:hypothetical protein
MQCIYLKYSSPPSDQAAVIELAAALQRGDLTVGRDTSRPLPLTKGRWTSLIWRNKLFNVSTATISSWH